MKAWKLRRPVLIGLGLCIASMVISGCAFGDRNIALDYEAAKDLDCQGAGRIAVANFEDVRHDKIVVGEVRNGFGMKTADVRIAGPLAGAWVANALATELRRAGFDVVKVADPSSPAERTVVGGSVSELFIHCAFALNTTLRAQVIVTESGVPVLNREYHAQTKTGGFLGGSSDYERAAKAALQELMKEVVPDIVEVMK